MTGTAENITKQISRLPIDTETEAAKILITLGKKLSKVNATISIISNAMAVFAIKNERPSMWALAETLSYASKHLFFAMMFVAGDIIERVVS